MICESSFPSVLSVRKNGRSIIGVFLRGFFFLFYEEIEIGDWAEKRERSRRETSSEARPPRHVRFCRRRRSSLQSYLSIFSIHSCLSSSEKYSAETVILITIVENTVVNIFDKKIEKCMLKSIRNAPLAERPTAHVRVTRENKRGARCLATIFPFLFSFSSLRRKQKPAAVNTRTVFFPNRFTRVLL